MPSATIRPSFDPGAGGDLTTVPVLVVDDNPADVLLLAKAFAVHDVKARVFVAADGAEAIFLVHQIDASRISCPELIVLDLNLPKNSGFEVLDQIRSSQKCRETPVVVFSSSDDPNDRMKAAEHGASRYLTKPFHLAAFIETGKYMKSLLPKDTSRTGHLA